MAEFLDDDYEPPTGGDKYFKLKQGENRLRILDRPLVGWVGWVEKNGKRKPIRRIENSFFEDSEATGVEIEKVRHFWALPVWDYSTKSVRVWEIVQATIQKPLYKLARDPEWGAPMLYDISITKTGESSETKYAVVPKPAKELGTEAREAWMQVCQTFDLRKLLENGDPFGGAAPSTAPEDGDEIPF